MRAKRVLICLLILSCCACVPNKQWRQQLVESYCHDEQVDCSQSYLEKNLEYDLGFIEFTERGNLFNRLHALRVLNTIDQEANSEDGVAVFVFVHGWKHNAQDSDSNVQQFREFLSRAAENEIVGKRKVFGVYLGWRGNFTNIPVVKETSYWARKSVAEEVGGGGVTEVLLMLHQILVKQFEQTASTSGLYQNNYVIIGHSFGGAIVLSALHEVLLKDLVEADPNFSIVPHECQRIRRFADALILLNPAIEANKAVLLKEAAARCLFDDNQPKLMHVLSSDGDIATNRYFPMGQYLNIANTRSPQRLKRRVGGKTVSLSERKLDRQTAGNFKPFRTHYIALDKDNKRWQIHNCNDSPEACKIRSKKSKRNHITVHPNDPLAFIQTDRNFIKGHDDVFGCYVQSYISAIVFETQSLDYKASKPEGFMIGLKESPMPENIEGCDLASFNFQQCFASQLEDYDCPQPR